MSETKGSPLLLVAFAGAAFLVYQTYMKSQYEKTHYDPNFKYTLAMREGRDKSGTAHYWANRILDPAYLKNEAMRYDKDMIQYVATHREY